MHIVYMTVEFVTEKISGGLSTYVDNMARIMRQHGHQVTVITLSHENGEFDYYNQIHVIRVREDMQQNILFRTVLNSWRLKKALDRVIQQDKVDIVQTSSLHAIGLFRSYKLPYIVRISSDNAVLRYAERYTFDLDKAMHEKTLFDRMELYAVRHADYAFAPSRYCAEIVSKRAQCRVAVLESPYLDRTIDFDDSVYRKKLEGKKYLLFNSALSTLKGTPTGLEAADELMVRYPDLHMVYAGIDAGIISEDGNCVQARSILNRLSKKYDGRVLYLGSLKREQLFPVIVNAYACVLLSRTENLSNSCIEAMSMKKIVIATYGASFEQLIKNKDNGLLVKRDSSKALLRAVAYLMNMTEEEKAKMEERAAASIERLNPERIYEKMISVYNHTIQNFRRKLL